MDSFIQEFNNLKQAEYKFQHLCIQDFGEFQFEIIPQSSLIKIRHVYLNEQVRKLKIFKKIILFLKTKFERIELINIINVDLYDYVICNEDWLPCTNNILVGSSWYMQN